MKIYELAQNLKEARELRDAGFGYETKAAALKAKKSPEIDSHYANLLKVFELELPTGDALRGLGTH
jgi:hypothetical protein